MTNYPAIDKATVNRLAALMGNEHLALFMDDGCWMLCPMGEDERGHGVWHTGRYLGRSAILEEAIAQAEACLPSAGPQQRPSSG